MGKCLDWLGNCYHLQKDSAPWIKQIFCLLGKSIFLLYGIAAHSFSPRHLSRMKYSWASQTEQIFLLIILDSCDRALWSNCEERKPTRCNNQMFIIATVSTCFRHHFAHLQEIKDCVTAFGVLFWFCWMWLVAVVGRCIVGCEQCEGYCSNSNLHTAHILQLISSDCCILLVFSLFTIAPNIAFNILSWPSNDPFA